MSGRILPDCSRATGIGGRWWPSEEHRQRSTWGRQWSCVIILDLVHMLVAREPLSVRATIIWRLQRLLHFLIPTSHLLQHRLTVLMLVYVLVVMGVVVLRLPRFKMPVLALALILVRQRRRIVGRRDADIGVAEEQPDLFERLVLRLGEEEVRDDAVTEVAGHVDEEVSPADVLMACVRRRPGRFTSCRFEDGLPG